MIKVTEKAVEKLRELVATRGKPGYGLRLSISGRGPAGFRHELRLAAPGSETEGDRQVAAGGLVILIDPESAAHLAGASIDYIDDGLSKGFKIDNPNPLWKDPVSLAVQQVLDSRINPAVAAHGGYVSLLEVRDGTAYVALGGGCQGCGLADVTLKQGIDVMIREAVPQIERVVDSTDHASGTNPYYRPAKGGKSPFG